MRGRLSLRSERGASLVMTAVFLPVLFAFFAFVVDAGHAFGVERATQNAADAAALAAAQDLEPAVIACGSDLACYQASEATYRPTLAATALSYSQQNGSADGFTELPECDPDVGIATNCYRWPYPDDTAFENYLRIEVILQNEAQAFFAPIVGKFFGLDGSLDVFEPAARAVAAAEAVSQTTCVPSAPPGSAECNTVGEDCNYDAPSESGDPGCPFEPEIPPQQGILDIGEESHCVFAENEDGDPDNDIEDPDQYLGTDPPCTIVESGGGGGVEGSQGFAMSRVCDAILYKGTPGTGQSDFPILGAFGTNGGLTFQGTGGKRLNTLGFDKARCGSLLPEPPNGNPANCDAAATVLPRGQRQSCVRNLVDFGDQLPLNWPVTPPLPPTPLPPGTTWDPAVHYPRRCTLLSPPPGGDTVTLNVVPGPPGIYCVSGPTTVLLITNDMTAGDGYTFFALDGARIEVASNGTDVKFYWPSACPSPDTGVVGERPTTRWLSFVCFDRRIVGYDPLTLFYSSQSTAFPATCDDSAICIHGQGGAIEGDIFAPEPRSAAPPTSLTQGGGTVWVAGGGAAAGNGFVEAWLIRIEGNSATYNGTGPLLGGNPVVITQGELELGEDATCIFDPPVADPEQYVGTDPPCHYPGVAETFGELVDTTTYGEPQTVIVGADVGMDE